MKRAVLVACAALGCGNPGEEPPQASALPKTVVKLAVKVVDDGSTFMTALAAHATDPDAVAAGIHAGVDAWMSHRDSYLVGKDRATLAGYIDRLRTAGQLAIPPDHELAFGPLASGGWRTYFVFSAVELDVRGLDRGEPSRQPSGHDVVMLLYSGDAEHHLAELTTRLITHKLAVFIDGDVLAAPVMTEPGMHGHIDIVTANEAEARMLSERLPH